MFQPTIQRLWQGIEIAGDQISLLLLPRDDGRISVQVRAQPALTGWDDLTRITPDELPSCYTAGEIVVHDTEISCMAANELVPFCRYGFTMTLEPGMEQLLRAWIPQLFDVATLASEIVRHVDPLFRAQQPPMYVQHLYEIYTTVAAAVILDGRDPLDAIATEKRFASVSDYSKPVWDMFEAGPVQEDLHRAHTQIVSKKAA